MALVLKDRVKVTTTSTGTGTITLGSAVSGFQSFSVIGDGNSTYYTISDNATGAWEVGIGTYTASGTTLSRDVVLESSNSGSLVDFAAGEKSVFVTYPAEKSSVSFYTTKTANYTAGPSEGVIANTTGGSFTVTLPASPITGTQVVVSDGGGLFGTNNLTVGRNGSTIGGLAEDLVLDINGVTVNFIYNGTTWLVYSQVGGNGGNAVTLDGIQTLTNKTINGDNNTITNIDLAGDVKGTLPVGNGGTGAATLTANNVLLGNGSNALQVVAPGASGNVLTSNGTTWVSAAIAAGATIKVVSKTTTYTAVAGDSSSLFNVSGTWTLSLTAAATLKDGWFIFLQNTGTGIVTVYPNASETIGGATTAACNPGDVWLIACNGTNFNLSRLAGNNFQLFDSSGTFTVPAGVERIYVECWGGGGGGGRNPLGNTPAAGGGSGGYSAGWINVSPGDAITATVGSGGAGGTASVAAGGTGGNTTFSSFTANGGKGGSGAQINNSSNDVISYGGSASGGSINIAGEVGTGANVSSIDMWAIWGGSAPNGGSGGATSVYPLNSTKKSINAEAPGGGGYGGNNSNPGFNGGAGAVGRILVRWV